MDSIGNNQVKQLKSLLKDFDQEVSKKGPDEKLSGNSLEQLEETLKNLELLDLDDKEIKDIKQFVDSMQNADKLGTLTKRIEDITQEHFEDEQSTSEFSSEGLPAFKNPEYKFEDWKEGVGPKQNRNTPKEQISSRNEIQNINREIKGLESEIKELKKEKKQNTEKIEQLGKKKFLAPSIGSPETKKGLTARNKEIDQKIGELEKKISDH